MDLRSRLAKLSPERLITLNSPDDWNRFAFVEAQISQEVAVISAGQAQVLWQKFIDQLLFSAILHLSHPNGKDFLDSVHLYGQTRGFTADYLIARQGQIESLVKGSQQRLAEQRQQEELRKLSALAMTQPTELQHQTTLQPETHKIYPRSALWGKAEKIAEVFTQHGLPVEVLEPCNKSPRCDEYYFKKPVSIKFSQFKPMVVDAISNAGYNPNDSFHADSPLVEMADNVFSLQVIRPVTEWKLLPWMGLEDTLSDADLENCIKYFRDQLKQDSWEDPTVKIGVLTNGDHAEINLSASAFLFGDSESGKSMMEKVILLGVALALTPEQATIDLLDFKGGLTFGVLQDLPHVRTFIYNGISAETGERPSKDELKEQAASLFASLAEDNRERWDRCLESKVDCIQDYNRLYPNEAFQWRFVVIGEARKAKEYLGESFDYNSKEIVTQYRAMGLVLITDTQYPNMLDSFGPDTRSSFKTKIALKCLEQGANLMFQKGSVQARVVPLLVGRGDFVYNYPGAFRGQGFYITNSLSQKIVRLIQRLYQKRQLSGVKAPSLTDSLNNWVATNGRSPSKVVAQVQDFWNEP
jgi:hypothetical protein